MLRLILVMLLNLFMTLIQVSPNFGRESSNQLKQPEEGRIPANFYGLFVFHMTLFNLSSIYHLYYHLDQSVGVFEWIIFILALSGFVLRKWCYYSLHKFFTYNLCIKKDHQLIEDGPYEYLVHPSYTGQMALTLFSILFLRNYFLFVVILGYIIYRLPKRTEAEEKMMSEHFGEKYSIYLSKRYRLIPGVY